MTSNGLLPEAKLYATDPEVQKAWVEWSKFRECSKCHRPFHWLSAFGAWECRQHLGPITSRRVVCKRTGISKLEWRYWDCCGKKPYTVHRQTSENVWGYCRATRPVTDRFPMEPQVPGCVPCDHTESDNILDDGIRTGLKVMSDEYSFGPEGGYKVNDTVLYNGEEKMVTQVYFDKTVDLQDVDKERIKPHKIIWPGVEYNIGPDVFCDWNLKGASMPVKIISNSTRKGICLKIMDLGMAVHEIAAMIPHMPPGATERPGWQFEERDGRIVYPHIRNAASRLKHMKKY
jgi:hypothetical protein